MSWFADNMAETMVIVGLAMLAIEILVLGFTTFILLFVGIAAIVTGALMYMAILPDTLLAGFMSMGIITALSALVLWGPLKKMQMNVDPTEAKNDLIGHRFTLPAEVSEASQPEYKFSGIMWRLTADETLPAGTNVEVIHTDVGQLKVRAFH